MTLGVGGATPFASKSNHQTALNHCFRETSGFDPSKQTKVKCSFCGCWARRGQLCYQCKRPAGGGASSTCFSSLPSASSRPMTPRATASAVPPPRANSTIPNNAVATDHSINTPRPSTAANHSALHTSRVPDNASQHKFRETSSYDPSARLRVKCTFCGCWASRGQHCYFCKTFNK